jgi:hypothetical protein
LPLWICTNFKCVIGKHGEESAETVLEEDVEKRMSEMGLEEDASIPEKDVSIHDDA